MTGPQSQAPITSPVTYEELTPEHKQKYDEVKAQFEADLIGSFERTRNHGIRWKGFSPEGALDNVDLSVLCTIRGAHQSPPPGDELHGGSHVSSALRKLGE